MSKPIPHAPFKESGLGEMSRDLGRSRSGQILVALAIMAFFSGLAWLAWTNQEKAGQIFALCLVAFGWTRAWPVLPIPAATRERWQHEEEIVRGSWAAMFRFFLPFGLYLAFKEWVGGTMHFKEPALYLTIGLVSVWLCRRKIRTTPASGNKA